MRKSLLLPLIAILAVSSLLSCHPPKKTTVVSEGIIGRPRIEKRVLVKNGAVVSAHVLASQVGVDILKKGGNAFDAAIATQLALAVVYPNAGNLGGGGFMVARMSTGQLLALDYREKAPAAGHKDMYLDAEGRARTDWSQDGHLSAGVPGTVAGLFAMHQYARLPMKDLIEPAIQLAEKGFLISAREARALNSLQADLKKNNTVMPVFVNEKGWSENDPLIQTDLANTLKRIKKKGKIGFYEGETARLIVEEMKRGKGIISYDDLKNYEAKFREPQLFTYKSYEVVGMPMPSSGGLLVNQMMKMVENKPLPSYGFLSANAVQLMTEVERRAYADRATYMGDADFYNVPAKELASEKYLQKRMQDFQPGKAGNSQQVKPGQLPGYESEETTHLSVIDGEGNAVSVTTTLNNSYGSRTVVGGAGFLLNDEMDDFSIKPGVPNMYGAIGGEANAIAPGKRMLSSMTPTLVLKAGKPFLVVGTPGGTTIPTSVFQTLINIIDFGMTTEDALYQPKFHHQWLPDVIEVEKAFPLSTRLELEKMGYSIKERGSIGRTEIIKVRDDGTIEAVADNRGEDAAAGY